MKNTLHDNTTAACLKWDMCMGSSACSANNVRLQFPKSLLGFLVDKKGTIS